MEPLLYKRCADGLIRRCIPQNEAQDVLRHCYSFDVGGHFGATKMASKVLQYGFGGQIYLMMLESLFLHVIDVKEWVILLGNMRCL